MSPRPGGATSQPEPAAPRPAATVVVATPAAPPFEVLLLQRPLGASFGAGAWAFPGGAIDDDDALPMWASRMPGVGEPVACVAALRELFEETGIAPADAPNVGPGTLAASRRSLLARAESFSGVVRRLDLDFSKARVAYFARWITPLAASMRFDTRFFLLALDRRPGRVSLTPEHDAALWATPDDALRRFTRGQLPMMFPTVRTLERLAGFSSLDDAAEALRGVPVDPALVRLRVGEAGVRPLAPGDPGYEETP